MSRSRHRLVPAALVSAAVVLLPGAVAAHAVLVSSDPADGEVVPRPPAEVRGTFSELIDPARSHMEVLGPDGSIVARGSVPAGETRVMVAEMTAPLPAGAYTVQWTTVTPDDDGVERGELSFQAEAASASPSPSPTALASPRTPPPSPSASPSATASPAPGAAPSRGTSDAQVLVPIVAVVVLAGLLGWRLFGGRSSP